MAYVYTAYTSIYVIYMYIKHIYINIFVTYIWQMYFYVHVYRICMLIPLLDSVSLRLLKELQCYSSLLHQLLLQPFGIASMGEKT